MTYLLYSPRMQGWFTKSSTYSSDVNDAKTYDREEALATCRRQKTQGGYNMLPVRQVDMSAI
jgi:hypothetical protein